MQFVVMARDGNDPDAVARRHAVRPTTSTGIQPLVDAGNILAGGAMLDDDGSMRGSVLLVEFPSRVELDAWLDHDPYVTGGVWQQIEVVPFRVAVGAWMPEESYEPRGHNVPKPPRTRRTAAGTRPHGLTDTVST